MNGQAGAFDYSRGSSKSSGGGGASVGISQVRGLVGITDKTAATTMDLSADSVVFQNSSGFTVVVSNIARIANNPEIVGPNGRDFSATWPTNSIAYFYFIYNGSTVATLSSLTPPKDFGQSNLPPGFTYWAFATAVPAGISTSAGTFSLSGLSVRGSKVYPSSYSFLLSSGGSAPTTGGIDSLSLRRGVPACASAVEVSLSAELIHSSTAFFAISAYEKEPEEFRGSTPLGRVTLNSVPGVKVYGDATFLISNINDPKLRVSWTALPSDLSSSMHHLHIASYSVPNGDN